MQQESYESRRAQLLRSFDRSVARLKPAFTHRYGEREARILVRKARQQYEGLIPHIPYIGDGRPC